MSDLGRYLAEIRNAEPGYLAAREYDDIDMWSELDSNSRAARILRQADVEFDPNMCTVVIDAVADRMTISSLVGANDEETELINEVWESQKLDLFWPTWQRFALRDGDGYIMTWPKPEEADPSTAGNDDAETTIDIEAAEARVYLPDELNITYVDPLTARLFYDPKDPRRKRAFVYYWEESGEDSEGKATRFWRLNVLKDDYIYKYASKATTGELKEPDPSDFAPWIDTLDGGERVDTDPDDMDPAEWPEQNPFGEIPVEHLRTDVPYGKPEHKNAFGLQGAISKLMENLMVTVNFQGWPQRYAVQEAENLATQTIREDPLDEAYRGDPDDLEDGDGVNLSRLRDGDISTETGNDFEDSPGGMHVFKGFKEVGQFVVADPTVFLEPWREAAAAIASTTSTPSWKFRVMGGDIPSGEALKVGEAPLNKKAKRRITLAISCIRGIYAFALRLCGAPDVTVTVEYEPVETVNETERWTLVKLRTDAGVPLREALMMAGIPEEQAKLWEGEHNQAQEEQRNHEAAMVAAKGGASTKDKAPAGAKK